MKTATLVPYALAFVLQMAGAAGVVQDVRISIRNMRQFKDDLTEAKAAADEHSRQIATIRDRPGARGLQRVTAQIAAATGERWVDQTGPGAAAQRRAVVKYVTAQNDISDRRRWFAVGLLLLGLVVGFIGNVLSLLPL
ncbi:hypothetical protein H7K33_07320 [Mycobacterium paraense]|uniref:hypothetical protein n=1 Tax=Mycobacterium paraense TaxID=767916 RepID=UPI000A15B50E|nr:hypothetical protein [Mycobacterium paraense]MCV7442030.1 hypothetical protein [Mycobacterium paraense]ORW41038.1 hypothetical protein AWB89_21170 [Mycobacterium paraense]